MAVDCWCVRSRKQLNIMCRVMYCVSDQSALKTFGGLAMSQFDGLLCNNHTRGFYKKKTFGIVYITRRVPV